MKYKVKNIGDTLQILYDKRGKRVSIKGGETVTMINPPKDSYQFKVTKIDKEKLEQKQEQKKIKKEDK